MKTLPLLSVIKEYPEKQTKRKKYQFYEVFSLAVGQPNWA
jgi:hypothetical protein